LEQREELHKQIITRFPRCDKRHIFATPVKMRGRRRLRGLVGALSIGRREYENKLSRSV
jgi:hypothetical protein